MFAYLSPDEVLADGVLCIPNNLFATSELAELSYLAKPSQARGPPDVPRGCCIDVMGRSRSLPLCATAASLLCWRRRATKAATIAPKIAAPVATADDRAV